MNIAVKTLTIHIAEATGLALLGVMKAACPVDGNIAFIATESRGTLYG